MPFLIAALSDVYALRSDFFPMTQNRSVTFGNSNAVSSAMDLQCFVLNMYFSKYTATTAISGLSWMKPLRITILCHKTQIKLQHVNVPLKNNRNWLKGVIFF